MPQPEGEPRTRSVLTLLSADGTLARSVDAGLAVPLALHANGTLLTTGFTLVRPSLQIVRVLD